MFRASSQRRGEHYSLVINIKLNMEILLQHFEKFFTNDKIQIQYKLFGWQLNLMLLQHLKFWYNVTNHSFRATIAAQFLERITYKGPTQWTKLKLLWGLGFQLGTCFFGWKTLTRSFSLNDTSFPCKSKVEFKIVGSKPTRCMQLTNQKIIATYAQKNGFRKWWK